MNAPKKLETESKKIAVVLVRGLINVRKSIKDNLRMLRLYYKNYCVVVDNTPANMGMINKAKDYIAWGEIDSETYQELVKKRGEEYLGPAACSKNKIKYGHKFFVSNGKKYKKYFRLNPPKKGFGRKGIKVPFMAGGGLGYRGNKINDLLKRMI